MRTIVQAVRRDTWNAFSCAVSDTIPAQYSPVTESRYVPMFMDLENEHHQILHIQILDCWGWRNNVVMI